MGRSYEANVYLVSPAAPQALEFLLLQDTQQFWLQWQRNVAHLVQEQRPLSANSKRPIFCAIAPVKAPFSWPNSSLSSRSNGIAAQFSFMKGRPHRELRL